MTSTELSDDLLVEVPVAVVIDGVRAVLWTDQDGIRRAARDMCPHRRAPLSAGSVDGGVLRCPYHGWSFDGAGRCTLLPAVGPEGRIPGKAALQMLPVPDNPCPAPVVTGGGAGSEPHPEWLDGDTPGLENFWHPVARRADLAPGASLVVELLGRRWTLHDRCDGGLTAVGDGGLAPWAVKAHLHHLWLAPGEPMAPLPEVPEWGEPGWHHRTLDRTEGRFGAGLLVDNQLDAGHFAFVHAATFGNPAGARIPPADVLRAGTRVTSTMRIPITAANDHRAAGSPDHPDQHRTMHYQYEAPLHLRLRLDYEDMGGSTLILFSVVPLGPGRARMDADLFFSHPDGFTSEQLDERVAFEVRVIGEDIALQRRFEDLRLPLDPTEELHTRADRLSVQCRQVLRELLAGEPR